MKTHPTVRSMVAAVVALSLASSGTAWAGKKNDRHDYGHGSHNDKHYSYSKPYKKKYKRHHYKGRYQYPYNRGYGGRYYNYDSDDDSDEKLLIGLLVGGLLGYAVTNAQSDAPYEYQSYTPSPAQGHGGSAATCLQEREYQMKVIVSGREVEAYGTTCLQPDGSWSRGPARVAPF